MTSTSVTSATPISKRIEGRPVARNLLAAFEEVADKPSGSNGIEVPQRHNISNDKRIAGPSQGEITTKESSSRVGSFGRSFSIIKRGSCAVACGVARAFQSVLNVLGTIADTPEHISVLCLRLEVYVLPPFELLYKTTKLANVKGAMRAARESIDLLQLDLHYFTSGKWREHGLAKLAGNAAFFVSGITGTFCWLQDIGAVNLAKAANAFGNVKVFKFVPALITRVPGLKNMPKLCSAAQSVGNVRVFSWVPKASLGFITDRILGLAYLCFVIDAAQRLASPGNHCQKVKATLDIADNISSIALNVLGLIGMTNIIGLGIVGAVSLGLSLANIIYEMRNKSALEEKVEEREIKALIQT